MKVKITKRMHTEAAKAREVLKSHAFSESEHFEASDDTPEYWSFNRQVAEDVIEYVDVNIGVYPITFYVPIAEDESEISIQFRDAADLDKYLAALAERRKKKKETPVIEEEDDIKW